MKIALPAPALLLLALLLVSLAAFPIGAAEDGWIDLLASDDLSAWEIPEPAGWKVEGGILSRVGRGGNLVTRESFGDAAVGIEFRIPPGGNSGLIFRNPDNVEHKIEILADAGRPPSTGGSASSTSRLTAPPDGGSLKARPEGAILQGGLPEAMVTTGKGVFMTPSGGRGALAARVGALLLAGAAPVAAADVPEGAVPVEIRRKEEGFRLYRGGRPYFVEGAVYWADPEGRFPLEDLAARGGNSVRCGGRHVRAILDASVPLGLTATVGLPMKMEAVHGFDYDDEDAVREQLERILETVEDLREHPAVLFWAIGNELSMGYTNRRVWDAVNDAARRIHEIDPAHPTLTTIGEGSVKRGDIREIRRRCPALDLLGINWYQGVESVPERVRRDGWDRPYIITEWGPSGDWQVPRTEWGASIEETSTEKAELYVERYRKAVLADRAMCLGSYAFMWQWRHERTQTWYGMFLETGERTEAVNALQFLWTGSWPSNRAPRMGPVRVDGKTADVALAPGASCLAAVDAEDPEGDSLTFRWEVLSEVERAGYAGMGERRSKPIPGRLREAEPGRVRLTAPEEEGAYRLFVFVLDGQGNGASANVPFIVRGDGGATTDKGDAAGAPAEEARP